MKITIVICQCFYEDEMKPLMWSTEHGAWHKRELQKTWNVSEAGQQTEVSLATLWWQSLGKNQATTILTSLDAGAGWVAILEAASRPWTSLGSSQALYEWGAGAQRLALWMAKLKQRTGITSLQGRVLRSVPISTSGFNRLAYISHQLCHQLKKGIKYIFKIWI